jgi:mannose-6-phosphate isomerase-like protein (cupin superfamily)
MNAMKYFLVPVTIVTLAFLLQGGSGGSVSYVSHDKVSTALAKGGPLVNAPDMHLTVSGSHREKAGGVEVHDTETDVMYVVDGSATFVTGGTMIGGKDTKPGQHLGTDIQGGETHHLTKGDVVVVPAGTPHWFKEVPTTISYYVVKVLK